MILSNHENGEQQNREDGLPVARIWEMDNFHGFWEILHLNQMRYARLPLNPANELSAPFWLKVLYLIYSILNLIYFLKMRSLGRASSQPQLLYHQANPIFGYSEG